MRQLLLAAVIAGVTFIAFWVVTVPAAIPSDALAAHEPDMANGEVVFNAGGCASCHAGDDRTRTVLGGGLALPTPFGTFYAPNISPDLRDGIGSWSEADFVTALIKGTSPDGAHYYPAFPYGSYQRVTVADARDLFAYLKTLPGVSGAAPDHDLKFPFNIRRLVGVWKWLFLDGKPFVADDAQSAQWNRGAYLVNGLGHCAECHSPRDMLGGIVAAQRFAGGPSADSREWVPNITAAKLQDWSGKDLAYFLRTGATPDGDFTGGSMARVIKNTSLLSDDDRAAIAAYVKSLPAVDGPPRPKKPRQKP